MAYFDSYDKNIWNKLGNSYELFNPYSLTNRDVENSILIADEIISKYQKRNIIHEESIPFGSVLQGSVTAYYNLGMYSSAKKSVSILQKVQYLDNGRYDDKDLTVQSMAVRTGALVCKQPYYIEVPRVFNNSSIHFMAHEIAHMLKEENPLECRGVYTDLEVIPILIELISAHRSGYYNVFKKRELLMLDIALSFKKLHEDKVSGAIKKDEELAFNACYRQNIVYLNSFYYSLRLFSMYLDSPTYVLNIINDVLSGRLTTSDVINTYLSYSDDTYNIGLQEFRSRLK